MGKKCGKLKYFQKVLTKILIILKSIVILIYLDSLDKNLNTAKSRLKSLDFKNLDREKKNSGLDMMDNLDGFQKLVSTRRTFSISILIGLNCRDPHAYKKTQVTTYSLNKLKKSPVYYAKNFYSGSRLMGSLWDRDKLMPITN
jgi:hypothetical protein